MWARYVQFYLCQCMRRLRQQQFLTLSYRKKKVVSDPPEIHLNVSKQIFLNFHFFHWFKLDLVKMAKFACDELCQRMRRMQQQFASVCGSTLLSYAAHKVANCQRRWRIRQQNRVKMSFLQAYVAHAVALCSRMRRMRQQLASVDGAYGSKLHAYAPHTVALCQRRRRIRQQFASVHGAKTFFIT